ncbi:MAG TPA: [FeFe] hydrogenase H-cluster radical SAM maturase HydE [Candidatus Blautia faecavium]|uniref:[FeFe] hydrogenase H-cluster radical SAM maturase HydE n=1 Tax=Candidatus Blautia faecavium TaxID=2838487 RepID=A0A9D2RWM1_9FIRM|nr:[FeFe] hydrogenase H-cluster radical SAM maturase HydE [Candidatus Blautia faecavium]
MKELIDKLYKEQILSREEFFRLLTERTPKEEEYARNLAAEVREKNYGKDIFIRGLIEFTNYCKNDCFYCGIRKSNKKAQRYRLTLEEILSCCQEGYELGFRTFVLQGGEDGFFTKERIVSLIHEIKERYPDCALTLSIGEKPYEEYQAYKEAGADRYLLRHETADEEHYRMLHPEPLSLAHRKECLRNLKKLGFQTGAGFMVGSPGQTAQTLVKDFLFLKELQPQMVGIGPFIPHQDTPFREKTAGTLKDTLFYLALIRLMLPKVLLPATTALGTIHPKGRELGILSGANVVMPNLSPSEVRKKYMLYDNKICTGEEAAEGIQDLKKRMQAIGCKVVTARGDYKG